MDFKDWVIASLGLPQDIGSAIELNLQLAAKTVAALNSSSSRLDEETLTGAMIGALVASHPMSAACFPSDQVSAIQWSGYAKHGSGINSERSSGADFALVISLPDGRLRLAIFQAKSDWSASATKNTLVVGQIKEVPEEKGADGIVVHDAYFRNQIKALVETANGIELKDNKSISISNLSWVHYLCQFQLGIKAVALSQIESHVLQSIESCKEVRFSLTPDNGVQLDLLLKSSCSQKADGWLNLPTLDDAGLPVAIDLSALVELMPVVVAREGSGGPQVKLVMGVKGTTLSEPLLDLQEPTPVPVPAKKFGMS